MLNIASTLQIDLYNIDASVVHEYTHIITLYSLQVTVTVKTVVFIPTRLTALTEYRPPSLGNWTGLRVSVLVAGGEVVLVLVMISIPVSVTESSSMNQLISVRGRLKSVILTVKVRVSSTITSTSLSAGRVGPTTQRV